MQIIGISGLARSGKDTVANLLVENYNFTKIAFADPIKRFIMELWDIHPNILWGPSENRGIPDDRYQSPNGESFTVRKALQFIGTEIGRNLDEDCWVRKTMNDVKSLYDSGVVYYPEEGIQLGFSYIDRKGIVIADVRFLNERDAIKKENGLMIRVKNSRAGLSGESGKHQSETELNSLPDSEFDYVINNDGTLEELKLSVDNLFQSLKK